MSNGLMVSNANSTIASITEGVKHGVTWLGRKISIGWVDYVVPAVRIAAAALITGYGVAGVAATLALFVTYNFVKSNDLATTKTYERIAFVVALIASGAAIAIALSVGPANVIQLF